MATNTVTITLRVRFAWWVMPYLHACATFAWLTGMTPDVDKILATAMRGVRLVQV